ncbi:hypothetical protein TUM4438_22460 [Shewanella sairae]|uniref:Uncharacterized protein n=1 Tax=Shewanella sairae TaxID=190310 RepID=A0ABQ4PG17_9GAMM|nr:hypothetical protein TUM4438_22460 [Shewanella sairae]
MTKSINKFSGSHVNITFKIDRKIPKAPYSMTSSVIAKDDSAFKFILKAFIFTNSFDQYTD